VAITATKTPTAVKYFLDPRGSRQFTKIPFSPDKVLFGKYHLPIEKFGVWAHWGPPGTLFFSLKCLVI